MKRKSMFERIWERYNSPSVPQINLKNFFYKEITDRKQNILVCISCGKIARSLKKFSHKTCLVHIQEFKKSRVKVKNGKAVEIRDSDVKIG